jgi:hypothetical protein
MTSALEEVKGQRYAPAALYPRERPGTHCTGGWRLGGPQGRSGQVRKISPPPGFDPRTVQPEPVALPTELPDPHSQYVSASKSVDHA